MHLCVILKTNTCRVLPRNFEGLVAFSGIVKLGSTVETRYNAVLGKKREYYLKSDFSPSLVLPDDLVRKFTRPCPFCTRNYKQTNGFFGPCFYYVPDAENVRPLKP